MAAHIDCVAKAHLSFRVSPSGCGDLKLNELLDLRLLYGDTVAGERGLMCTDRVSHQGHLDGVITSPLKISRLKAFSFCSSGLPKAVQRCGLCLIAVLTQRLNPAIVFESEVNTGRQSE